MTERDATPHAFAVGKCKEDKERAALSQGVYMAYMTKTKRKRNEVLRRIL